MKKILLVGSALIIVLILAAGGWYFLSPGKVAEEPLERVTVAYSPFESTALVWIAEDRHFFF